MAILNINERQIKDVTILDLEGKITIGENCSNLRASIRRLLGENKIKILLNVDKVSYIDSSGLGEIVSGFTAVKREGGALKLLHLTDHFEDVLILTKLLIVFDCFENEEDAVGSYKEKEAFQSVR